VLAVTSTREPAKPVVSKTERTSPRLPRSTLRPLNASGPPGRGRLPAEAGIFVDPAGGVGVGVSGWLMGGVKDTPSSEPLGEVFGESLAVVKDCVSPKASSHLFLARRR
jgi:hypothetical protein